MLTMDSWTRDFICLMPWFKGDLHWDFRMRAFFITQYSWQKDFYEESSRKAADITDHFMGVFIVFFFSVFSWYDAM